MAKTQNQTLAESRKSSYSSINAFFFFLNQKKKKVPFFSFSFFKMFRKMWWNENFVFTWIFCSNNKSLELQRGYTYKGKFVAWVSLFRPSINLGVLKVECRERTRHKLYSQYFLGHTVPSRINESAFNHLNSFTNKMWVWGSILVQHHCHYQSYHDYHLTSDIQGKNWCLVLRSL